jgi:hypothetical protein
MQQACKQRSHAAHIRYFAIYNVTETPADAMQTKCIRHFLLSAAPTPNIQLCTLNTSAAGAEHDAQLA